MPSENNISKLEIRRGRPEDYPFLVSMVKPMISPGFHWPEENLLSELTFADSLVAVKNSEIVGFICVRDMSEAYEVSVLATKPECQGQGIMGAMFDHLIAEYGSRRQLWLEVHEKNLTARKLYEKKGFKAEGKRGGYYRDGSAAFLFTLAQVVPGKDNITS